MLDVQQITYIGCMNVESTYPLLHKTDPSNCLALQAKILHRVIDKIYRKHLAHYQITAPQLNILFVMGKKQQLAQAQLGKILVLERSTVTKDLKRLIAKGYLVKSSNGHPVVEITAAGNAFLERIIPVWKAAGAEAEALLTQQGAAQLCQLVKQIR
jgi:DNA-binding MarR family transcriptional regulator